MRKENNSIEYYYKKNRYLTFLKNTKIYIEFFWSKEALLCSTLSVLSTTIIFYLIFNFQVDNISSTLNDLVGIIIGSLVGLLGFIIGGLALIVGTIGNRLISKINNENKFDYLLSIIFRFYFVGSILGVTILLYLFTYLILLFPIVFNLWLTLIGGFLVSYFFFYSLFSSIMLIGTCIRLMLLNYKFKE